MPAQGAEGKKGMRLMMPDEENDDEGFIQAMELAIDWCLAIMNEEWERYKALMGREDED